MATDQTPLFIDQTYPYVKPPLPYAFDALEPYIDAKTMEIHYTKYLQNYIDNLNINIENTLKRLKAAAMSVFGSGYAWLVADRNGNIGMIITVNQETPLPIDLCPLLNLDVWEHAYFLKHYNDRSSYIDDWFHLINWKQVETRYAMCPFWSSQALESPEQLLL